MKILKIGHGSIDKVKNFTKYNKLYELVVIKIY